MRLTAHEDGYIYGLFCVERHDDRFSGFREYADIAARQYKYFADHFIDREYGGCYWSINPDGIPCDTKKQFYAIAFAIYALSEYHMLTNDKGALDHAVRLFNIIEKYSRDRSKGGYFEAMTRDWQPIGDMRLSDKDLNSSKTMNTHLHILEMSLPQLPHVHGGRKLAESHIRSGLKNFPTPIQQLVELPCSASCCFLSVPLQFYLFFDPTLPYPVPQT